MKISVSAYSYSRLIDEKNLSVFDVIDIAVEQGFKGIEFTSRFWDDNNPDPEFAKKVKSYCAEKGIEICAYCIGANFLRDTEEAIARAKRHVDFAAALGTPYMRHDVAYGWAFAERKYSIGFDDALPILVPAIREVAEYAQSKGVGTITENHGHFSQDAERVEKLINAVAHPNFGALVDIGNFMCVDEDPVKSVAIMAPYAKHVHAKDFYLRSGNEIDPGEGWGKTRACNYIRGAIIGHGNAKVYQSIQILKKNGYDGFISIEFEGSEDCREGMRIVRDNLFRFIG